MPWMSILICFSCVMLYPTPLYYPFFARRIHAPKDAAAAIVARMLLGPVYLGVPEL